MITREQIIEAMARSIRATITESPEKSWNYHASIALDVALPLIQQALSERVRDLGLRKLGRCAKLDSNRPTQGGNLMSSKASKAKYPTGKPIQVDEHSRIEGRGLVLDAVRAAYDQGRIDALREAAQIARSALSDDPDDWTDYAADARARVIQELIRARAARIEQEARS